MKTSLSAALLLTATALYLIGCTESKTVKFADLSQAEKDAITANYLMWPDAGRSVKVAPIEVREANALLNYYRDILDDNGIRRELPPTLPGGVRQYVPITFRSSLYSNLRNTTPSATIYPSYKITKAQLDTLLNWSNQPVGYVQIFPANHRVPKPGGGFVNEFTLILVGRDSTGRLTTLKKLPSRPSEGADRANVWQYIDPCSPNCGNIQ